MARIAGINIPMNKHVWVGLTHIYGIGRARALQACEVSGVNPSTRVKDLTEVEVNALRSQIGSRSLGVYPVNYQASTDFSSSAFEARADCSCPPSWKKISDRYCVPTSGPWRFSVVGSWLSQKIPNSCS